MAIHQIRSRNAVTAISVSICLSLLESINKTEELVHSRNFQNGLNPLCRAQQIDRVTGAMLSHI
jgi:hypothetical protein